MGFNSGFKGLNNILNWLLKLLLCSVTCPKTGDVDLHHNKYITHLMLDISVLMLLCHTCIGRWLGIPLKKEWYRCGKPDYTYRRRPVATALLSLCLWVDCVWNVMVHAQKSFIVRFRLSTKLTNSFKSAGGQFSRLLAGELCTSACRVCTARASLCSAVMWRLLATHSIRLFPLYFSSRASPCAITFQLDSTSVSEDTVSTVITENIVTLPLYLWYSENIIKSYS